MENYDYDEAFEILNSKTKQQEAKNAESNSKI